MNITRRNFMKGGFGLASVLLSPLEILALAQAAKASGGTSSSKALVVVQLGGGNDGLNTVVPYGMGAYYQARPQLAIPAHQVLPLSNQIGLHPNMRAMADLYKQDKLAVMHAVGYPGANRSHFRSVEIWKSAYPDQIADTSWLDRYLDFVAKEKPQPLIPNTHLASKLIVPSISQYPDSSFGHGLKIIAQMIVGGIGSRIYNISLDGFDTHANQARTQANLLKELSEGLSAFQSDLEYHGVDQNVLTMTFSEFGRRVAENNEQGTDHGTCGPMFIIGSAVNGGIYGNHASLTNLDHGDLKYQIDFRTIYATILDRWLGADSRQILGANYDQINFV